MSKFVAATYATQRYDYALPNFGRRLAASIHYANASEGTFLFIGDMSETIKDSAYKFVKDALPCGWEFEFIPLPLNDDLPNYKENAQLLIAQMQGTAFTRARQLNADFFWSLESDVLVAVNSLRVSLDSISYDNCYYDVCMCTYPSQGGGSFLGGFGDKYQSIYEDFTEEERDIPTSLKNKLKKHRSAKKIDQKWHDKNKELIEEVKKAPPIDNVFALNGKKWRKRGWMESAYPAIGKGSLLPTDWVGLGCTLMSRKALSYAHFDGYQGHGTQDLFLGYNYWKANDIKMSVSTHAICDHIIRDNKDGEQSFDNIYHIAAYHETDEEYLGHLRQKRLKFYKHIAGENSGNESISGV